MRFFNIVLILLLLTGCSNVDYTENITQDTYSSSNSSLTPYNLYVTNTEYTLSKYEPSEKKYIGTYIQAETDPKNLIEDFENNTNDYHSIYSYQLRLNEPFPLNFVLACYAKNKTPFITILPPENEEDTFNVELLKTLVNSFGNLNLPIFVNFYENPHLANYDENSYINFFKQAKNYFEIYAKNVALVWSIDFSNVYEINKYYPGDNFVDWVGINIYEAVDANNKIEKVSTELDYFYSKFQNKKPICISSLGISNFSNTTLNYVIDEKIEELTRYYSTIPEKYPRIKLINYLNYNNYSINDNKKILSAFNKLTKNEIFTQTLNVTGLGNYSDELEKLNFLIYRQGDYFLIEEANIESLVYNLKIDDFDKDAFEITNINNQDYYNLNEILKYYNLDIDVNENNKFLTVI